jgi:hypothetical protein
MKKLLSRSLFLVILLIAFSCNNQYDENDLFGVWTGNHRGFVFTFQFNRDHSCLLSIGDKTSGAIKIVNGDFETDFSKRPIPLTIRNIPQLTHPLHTIVSFKRDGSIQIATFAPRWRLRPIAFNKNASPILKRVKEKKSSERPNFLY